MPDAAQRILVTGANGHLGQQLLERLGDAGVDGAPEVRALVRSERAADQVRTLALARAPELMIGDYTNAESMRQAIKDCDMVAHTVGIIKESGGASYPAAHEDTCRVLAGIASEAGTRRIVYLSILGSRADSANACLASKGRAEQILLSGSTPATVLRVPMVLGPHDFASAALAGQAHSNWAFMVAGGATVQQPIDSRDVVSAILAAAVDFGCDSAALDLGGPEQLSHRDLVDRAAAQLGVAGPRVIAIPLFVARLFVAVLGGIMKSPPVTRAMFEILQHDDRVDEVAACQRLGLRLTPLDETLRHCLGKESPAS